MPLVKWSDSFDLGSPVIDGHHRQLLHLLNMVYDDATCGGSVSRIETILAELFDYATYHFATEEAWMAEMGYAERDEHMALHQQFIENLTKLVNRYHDGLEGVNEEVFTLLTHWLIDHIMESDREIIRCAVETGCEEVQLRLAAC